MNDPFDIRIRSWVRASAEDQRDGLEGYLSLFVGLLVVDNITLRRTAEGRYALSFPRRTSKSGQHHAIVRPIDDQARQAIEHHLLAQLRETEAFVP